MKVAVIRFPGANCDQDALYSLKNDVGVQADYVWHDENSLAGFDAVFVPGGFSYGDYLRCGAIAARARIMDSVKRFAADGRLVIGVCNGFQVLCEAGLLPGALMQNSRQKFICADVFLKAVNRSSPFTEGVDKIVRIPIAHGEGRFVCELDVMKKIQDDDRIAFTYCDQNGQMSDEANMNGSMNAVAGVLNERGNVLGLMPHPERATNPVLGNTDGRLILRAFERVLSAA